jgi:hypothetical protein
MKFVIALSAALLSIASPASSEPLREVDRNFAVLATTAWVVGTLCGNLRIVEGAAAKMADRNGADIGRIGPALVAAWQANISQDYDRSALVPEVTEVVRNTFNMIDKDYTRNKTKACADWTKAIMPSGLIERTN